MATSAILQFVHPTTLDPAGTAQTSKPVLDMGTEGENNSPAEDRLATYIRSAFDEARRFRAREGIDEKLLASLRAVRGEYDSETLGAIKKFGGSEIYARVAANKVRAVSASLREVYTSVARPWGITPTADPDIGGKTVEQAVVEVLKAEILELQANNTPVDPALVLRRREEIRGKIMQARQAQAREAANTKEDELDNYLQEGNFYNAFWDFLLDVATFPFAVIKGPSVEYRRRLKWKGGIAVVERVPHLYWERRSPFDVYFAPWSRHPSDGYVIDHKRTTRAALQALRGLPAYNKEMIDKVLGMSAESFKDWMSYTEQDRAALEERLPDNWSTTASLSDRPYPMLEFHGQIPQKLLLEWGVSQASLPKDGDDADVVAYLIGSNVIGVRPNPHPLGRKPFYVDSYERIPGSIYGIGVPGLIEDVSGVANATLRALVNNLSMSSGPQVVVNTDRLASSSESIEIYPWKVWPTEESSYSAGSAAKPIDFFQPESNAAELLTVFQDFLRMADTFSALPRILQGDMKGVATLGRSASGLSMAINAANRTIKQVVVSIDNTVLRRVIEDLNIYVTLVDPESAQGGDINVVARGASELVEREALRARRLEFLQITNNPTDEPLMGAEGRWEILKEIARDLKLPEDKIFAGVHNGRTPAPPPPPGQPAPLVPHVVPPQQPVAPPRPSIESPAFTH